MLYLAGDAAHDLGVRADDAELHRKANRRTQLEPGDTHPCLRELLICRGHQASAHLFASRQILGHYHELGVAGIGQLGIQGQVEAGGTGTDIGRIDQHLVSFASAASILFT